MALVLWFRDRFHVRLILAEAAFQVLGGGNTVVVAVLYSVVADIASEENRYVPDMHENNVLTGWRLMGEKFLQNHRATYFFYMAFSRLSGNIIGRFCHPN